MQPHGCLMHVSLAVTNTVKRRERAKNEAKLRDGLGQERRCPGVTEYEQEAASDACWGK